MVQPAERLGEGSVIGERFVIRRKIGGGGMGEVFLAENLNVSDKKYAVKVLTREFTTDPRFVTMLRDEAVKQARLEHDNVVGMYDFFPWGGHYCLVQTYIKGQTLSEMLKAQPAGLDRNQVITLMQGILAGLDHAHQAGILHCDVKPANVIVDPEGRPHVTDFGISRDIGASSGMLAGAGTVDYMSPEQIAPPYEVDHRTDVFSAGVLMFQMLCGRLPFNANPATPGGATTQLTHDAPDIRSFRADIPEPLARIVATALQRDPEHRFQGCGDFERALAEFRQRERWRRTWLPAIAVVSVLGIAGAIGLYQWRAHVADEVKQQEAANQAAGVLLAARKERAIDEALRNAAAALNLMCREAGEYRIKQAGIAMAQKSGGLDDTVRLFEAKLQSMRDSMGKQADAYAAAIRQLGAEPAALIAAGLARQAQADTLVRAFAETMTADEAALRAGRALPAADEMIGRCAAPTK